MIQTEIVHIIKLLKLCILYEFLSHHYVNSAINVAISELNYSFVFFNSLEFLRYNSISDLSSSFPKSSLFTHSI